MSYIGNSPANVPIGSDAIQDGSITLAKLSVNSVDASKIAAGAVDLSTTDVTGVLSVAKGGTGSSTPKFISIQGSLSCYVTQTVTYTITNYNSASTYTVSSAVLGSVGITGDTITFVAGSSAGAGSFVVSDGTFSHTVAVTVNAAGIATPSVTSPSNGATGVLETPVLTSSVFTPIGGTDTHLNSTWEIRTGANGTGTLITGVVNDTTNKTSWNVPSGVLTVSTVYYARVKHTGATLGSSGFSPDVVFTTTANFGGKIGIQGTQGFGLGTFPGTLPVGFSNTSLNTDVNNANYGNYTYSDGSVMCFIPRFYYRIGSPSSPRYATYGLNSVDILGIDTFASTAVANAAGYALHRAFIDGGVEKSGYFIDKYKCSNGLSSNTGTLSGAVKSQFGGVPISLTTTAGFTKSQNWITSEGTCTGILADSVLLARSRGIGIFNVPTIFMYSALSLLSLAHAQAATGTSSCAWYDASGVTNFPKGCNSGALADTNDSSVTYVTAGDSGTAAKPKTGATSNFNKTTHNGQASGVADLNGGLYEVTLGLTNVGSTATDAAAIATNTMYILKQSVSFLSLKAGWNTANDAWQSSGSIGTYYDALTTSATFSAASGVYWGSGTNQVFSGATSGAGWLNTGAGLPLSDLSTNATGTNQFGLDYCYKYNMANMVPLVCGGWGGTTSAGVFCRIFNVSRTVDSSTFGFRTASVS